MKKTFFFIASLLLSLGMTAQVEFSDPQLLEGTKGMHYCYPRFSPMGDYLLFTSDGYQGLVQYFLDDQSTKVLTTAENAGYEAQVSDGGKMVVFRDVTYKDNRRYTAIKRVNTTNGEVATVDAPSREKYAFDFSGGTIRVAKHNQILSQRLLTDIRPVEGDQYIVAIEDMDLVLYTNNTRRVLNPQGKCSYIWPNIAPDHQHIVYNVAQGNKFGTYVCDMHGENVVYLGYVGAPQWLGNEYITGMLDLWGDGYHYTHSPIVTIRIDGENLQIHKIPEHEIVLYPAATIKGDKIAFAAEEGVYMIDVTIK